MTPSPSGVWTSAAALATLPAPWLVHMPRARVTGPVSVDGRDVGIDAPVYQDHNRGERIPTDARRNRAQVSIRRLALVGGSRAAASTGCSTHRSTRPLHAARVRLRRRR